MSTATVPAERLYWARLPDDESVQTAQARRFRCERVVPVPVERLHVIEYRLHDGWLMVGMDKMELTKHLAAIAAPLCLYPDRIPAHLADAAKVDPALLNLLTGEFEPLPVRQERYRWHLTAVIAVVAVLLVLAVGALRRSILFDRESQRLIALRSSMLDEAVRAVPGTALPETRLIMALRQLEQQAQSDGASAGNQEAWEVLESVLAVWPADVPVQIETLTATSDRCVIRGAVTGLADADRLSKALATAPPTSQGVMRAEPLQVQQDGDRSIFVLTLMVTKP